MCYICFMPCPLRASKTFTLSFMVQVNHLGAASQEECIRWGWLGPSKLYGLTFGLSSSYFLSCLENLVTLCHVIESLILMVSVFTHTRIAWVEVTSWILHVEELICANWFLNSLLYLYLVLRCSLIVLLVVYTCVFWNWLWKIWFLWFFSQFFCCFSVKRPEGLYWRLDELVVRTILFWSPDGNGA